MDGKWWIKVKNSKGEEGWVEEDKLIINVQDPFASEVPAGIDDNGGRYHHSFGTPMNSNCTYYVAAAIKNILVETLISRRNLLLIQKKGMAEIGRMKQKKKWDHL